MADRNASNCVDDASFKGKQRWRTHMPELLRIERLPDGGWSAHGTREQILAADLCTPAHFPEGRKRYRCRWDLEPGGERNEGWWFMERLKGGLWRLMVQPAKEQRESLRHEMILRRRAAEALELMPKSAEEWRRERLGFISGTLHTLKSRLKPSDGFHFVTGTTEVEALIARIELVLANAETGVDEEAHAARISELQQAADPGAARVQGLRAPLRLVA